MLWFVSPSSGPGRGAKIDNFVVDKNHNVTLTGRYFGMANYGKIYGMLYMPFGLFSALSPLLYARVFDQTGSFDPILELAIPAFILGGGLLLFLGKYPESFPEAEAETEPAGPSEVEAG